MKFPVLCITRESAVFLALRPEELGATRVSQAWTDRIIGGMRIVDSSGECFLVRSYEIESPKSAVLQRAATLLELQRSLRLHAEAIAPLHFSEVKSAVFRSMEDDPEGFEELSGMDADWWLEELSRASSCSEVIRAFAKAAGAASQETPIEAGASRDVGG
ncbi:MAG: hypothetical protein U1E83_09245 [Methylotetracoccus sp.]